MFYRDQVEDILHRIQTLDRPFSFQLGYVIFFPITTIQDSCLIRWSDVTDQTPDDIAQYISRAPMDFVPYVFKYRNPASLYKRLDSVLRELGILDDIRLRDLKEAWGRKRPGY
ncbi:MAG: hypothetical protein L0Y80_12005 [Ignavibacteriae bacterium]|nr:hypothetical protein [Ignavibacteriota bacterium]